MNYIVLDLEWNQPLKRENTVTEPVALHGEIIQIGAVKLDEKFNIVDSFKVVVKPKFYRIINKHIQKLTGISQYELERGVCLEDAIKQFRKFCTKHCIWLIWGTDDVPMLRDNLIVNGIETEWIPRYFNLQVMFNDQVSGETRQWALEDAMTALMIENDLTAHDALNDAENTAKVAQKLDLRAGMAQYDNNSVRMQYSVNHTQTTKFSGYPSEDKALFDRNVKRSVCPVCAKKLPFGSWVGNKYTRLVSVISCPLHGKFKVSLHLNRDEDGTYSVTKTVKTASSETVKLYEDKLRTERHRRFGRRKAIDSDVEI